MSETHTAEVVQETSKTGEEKPKSIVEALLDVGAAWAAHGLHAGRFSLENSARALERTAKTLETLARQFEEKGSKKGEAA
jgi:hypothetical protein